MATYKRFYVTNEFLDANPTSYFVYGDNIQKQGHEGTSSLRDHPQSIGIITKKANNNSDNSFYRPEEYFPILRKELIELAKKIESNPKNTFYIPKIGSGLANRYGIWENIICYNLTKRLEKFENVVFCWD